MFWLKFMTLVVFAGYWFGSDAKVDVYLIDVIIEYCDPEYITDAVAYISEDSDNENALVTNFTIINSFPVTSEGHLEIIGASMGEYALSTGFMFDMAFCDLFDEAVMVGAFLTGLGFKAEECPPPPGIYGTSGWQFDANEIPSELPPNKYKLVVNLTDSGNLITRFVFLGESQ